MSEKIYRNKTIKDEGFPEAISMDDIEDGTTYGKINRKYVDDDGNIVAKTILLSEVNGTLDDIENGADFGKVALTAISAGKIVLTGGGGVTGILPVGNTDAKCTDANADQTSLNTAADTAKVQGYTLVQGGYIKSDYMTATNMVTGTLTGITVQTGTSGKRVVIASDVISIYSSNGSAGVIQGLYTGGVNYVNFTGPVQVTGEIVAGSTLRPSATGSKELGNNSFFWNNIYTYRLKYDYELGGYISGINNTGDSYTRIKFNATTGNIGLGRTIYPIVSNSYYCGTSANYWHRVYSDSYWTKNTTFQTFDKYDDLQILRDLRFGKSGKLVLDNLPKEIHDKGFINSGGIASFNLCASKKIVETVDDLNSRLKILETNK